MKSKIILVVIALFEVLTSNAQTFKSDMERLKSSMLNCEFNISYKLFTSQNQIQPIQSLNGQYWMSSECQLFKTKAYTLLNTKKVNLIVDYEKNIFFLDKNRSKSRFEFIDAIKSLVKDSLINFDCQYNLVGEDKGYRIWEVNFNSQMASMQKIELKIDLEKNELRYVKYFYRKSFNELFNDSPNGVSLDDKPVIVIDFSSFRNLKDNELKSVFDEKNFFVVKKGKVVPNTVYKGFRFIDYLNIK